MQSRVVEVTSGTEKMRRVTVTPRAPIRVTLVGPGPLRLYVHVPPGPVGARTFGVRVVSLSYLASY